MSQNGQTHFKNLAANADIEHWTYKQKNIEHTNKNILTYVKITGFNRCIFALRRSHILKETVLVAVRWHFVI